LPKRTETAASRSGGVAVRAPKKAAGAVGRRQRLIGGLLALTLAGVAYANVFNNPFVYDDYDTVVSNPSLVDVSNVQFVLVHSPFRPVVNMSYALDRLIWGFWAPGFHLTNVLLHGLVVGCCMRSSFVRCRTRVCGSAVVSWIGAIPDVSTRGRPARRRRCLAFTP
jgi:hypothetical protein